jgi:S-(hydroxymethyl)glutathione dehydrogenase/alcohol dehydrogenase
MRTQGAVLVETGRPLELADLDLPAPRPGQVLVEVAYSGVCHTQLLETRGYRGADAYLPHCLGHEGSGHVLETGPRVTKVMRGDAVVLTWMKSSGMEVPGTTLQWAGKAVNAGAVTTFSRHTLVAENRLVKLPDGVPLKTAALIGCAVATGVGSVINTARPRPGESMVVFGCGGVGLCAVAGAQLAGCAPIIAVDTRASRLEAAHAMGADHLIEAGSGDVIEKILAICPGGTDYAVEATGQPSVMSDALKVVRARGGTAVVAGNARHGLVLEIDPRQLNQGKRLLGTWGGDNSPDVDFERYFEMVSSGRLTLDPLLVAEYPLEAINQALDDLESGASIRPIVNMGSSTDAC